LFREDEDFDGPSRTARYLAVGSQRKAAFGASEIQFRQNGAQPYIRDYGRQGLMHHRTSQMSIKLCVRATIFCVSLTVAAVAQEFSAPEPQTGTIIGTVVDVNDDPVPGANVVFDAPLLRDHTRVVTNNNGFSYSTISVRESPVMSQSAPADSPTGSRLKLR
jgi:hypothetical protein